MNIESYKELYEERVAIMIIDGGVEEKQATLNAFAEVKEKFVADQGLSWNRPQTYYAVAKFRKELLKLLRDTI